MHLPVKVSSVVVSHNANPRENESFPIFSSIRGPTAARVCVSIPCLTLKRGSFEGGRPATKGPIPFRPALSCCQHAETCKDNSGT